MTHERKQPVAQRFGLRGYMLFVDLRRLDEPQPKTLRLLGFDRKRLHSLRRRDFSLIARTDQPAARQASDFLWQRSGIRADQVYLLANAAVFGYVFNPVSFFFCLRGGEHVATIVEVNNTFGEQKHFVLPAGAAKHQAAKDFYVSPFISPFAVFDLRVPLPEQSLSISIHTVSGSGTELAADMGGRWRELSDSTLIRLFLKYPLHTLRVIVLIHWFALKLFFRGVPHYAKAGADAALAHKALRRHS